MFSAQRQCMLRFKSSFELPHGIAVLAVHHDSQLFAGVGILALARWSCVAVDGAMNNCCPCLDFCELKIILELVEACSTPEASLFASGVTLANKGCVGMH